MSVGYFGLGLAQVLGGCDVSGSGAPMTSTQSNPGQKMFLPYCLISSWLILTVCIHYGASSTGNLHSLLSSEFALSMYYIVCITSDLISPSIGPSAGRRNRVSNGIVIGSSLFISISSLPLFRERTVRWASEIYFAIYRFLNTTNLFLLDVTS